MADLGTKVKSNNNSTERKSSSERPKAECGEVRKTKSPRNSARLVFHLRACDDHSAGVKEKFGRRFDGIQASEQINQIKGVKCWNLCAGHLRQIGGPPLILGAEYCIAIVVRWSKLSDWRFPLSSVELERTHWLAVKQCADLGGILGTRIRGNFYGSGYRVQPGWQLLVVNGQRDGMQHVYVGTRISDIQFVGSINTTCVGSKLGSIGFYANGPGAMSDVFVYDGVLYPGQIQNLHRMYWKSESIEFCVNPEPLVLLGLPVHKPGDCLLKKTVEELSQEILESKEEQKEIASEEKEEVSNAGASVDDLIHLPSVFDTMEHFVLYETSVTFYLVGHDRRQTRFRLLKIDRRVTNRMDIVEDGEVYNAHDMKIMLDMIRDGNVNTGGLTRCISAYGVIGTIKFLEGHYLILITERKEVGSIGAHIVYKIQKTAMIPIQLEEKMKSQQSKRIRHDEARYKNLFAFIDLSKEFYFSYTYDLTRTLQYNMCNHTSRQVQSLFIWNSFLLNHLKAKISCSLWLVNIIHGYFESSNCSVLGRELVLTLISRRSKKFAGTRYLKRGINDEGFSANDVETEQIIWDRCGGDRADGQFASHVQMRASIPLYWTQEPNAMVARPDISIKRHGASHVGIRRHFVNIFRRYGSPILALNLIRKEEQRTRESHLGKQFESAVKYLNAFLPEQDKIDYFAWDFKKVQKRTGSSVVDELAKISLWALQRSGFFHSNPSPEAISTLGRDTSRIKAFHKLKPEYRPAVRKHDLREKITTTFKEEPEENPAVFDLGALQRGVVRSNCIDSLDRTNVAQFCIGKCALGFMLYSFGLTERPELDAHSTIIRVLIDMYERMGDALALQYGGSQMHRQMQKGNQESTTMAPVLYRQKDPTTKPKEMLVSIMRHYRNSFQDNVKQDAMNLFLGYFHPDPSPNHIKLWELSNDYYLHSRPTPILSQPPTPLSISHRWFLDPIEDHDKEIRACRTRLEKRYFHHAEDRNHWRLEWFDRPRRFPRYRRDLHFCLDLIHNFYELTFFDERLWKRMREISISTDPDLLTEKRRGFRMKRGTRQYNATENLQRQYNTALTDISAQKTHSNTFSGAEGRISAPDFTSSIRLDETLHASHYSPNGVTPMSMANSRSGLESFPEPSRSRRLYSDPGRQFLGIRELSPYRTHEEKYEVEQRSAEEGGIVETDNREPEPRRWGVLRSLEHLLPWVKRAIRRPGPTNDEDRLMEDEQTNTRPRYGSRLYHEEDRAKWNNLALLPIEVLMDDSKLRQSLEKVTRFDVSDFVVFPYKEVDERQRLELEQQGFQELLTDQEYKAICECGKFLPLPKVSINDSVYLAKSLQFV